MQHEALLAGSRQGALGNVYLLFCDIRHTWIRFFPSLVRSFVPPLALLSCSSHLCNGKQRTEGWTESGSKGGEEGNRGGGEGGLGEREDRLGMNGGLWKYKI